LRSAVRAITLGLIVSVACAGVAAGAIEEQDLADLDIEDLLDIVVDVEVTTVSKKAQRASEAPAAVSVITQEDLRRSGVTTIPEALRMVPGLQVARVSGNRWAITARGFNRLFSEKPLVLIDGRSVQELLFAGVFWDVQDTLIEDIDRIEVIRGPGGSLWGSEAVNGVVNVVTKKSEDTQGLLVTGGGGNVERRFGSVRYGGEIGDDAHYRVYFKHFDRTELADRGGIEANDETQSFRGGFRLDWHLGPHDLLTLQGEGYGGESGATIQLPDTGSPPNYITRDEGGTEVFGGHVLGRWTHTFSERSDLLLQFYHDRTDRSDVFLEHRRNTWDVDFQHHFEWDMQPISILDSVGLVWGTRYRRTADDVTENDVVAFDPDFRKDDLFSGFAQGEFGLFEDHLRISGGIKLEHNSYTGFEWQPNARIAWLPHERHTIWASISRAVRTPSRLNHDISGIFGAIANPLSLPFDVLVRLKGNRDFAVEKLIAYELGYRVKPVDSLFFDLAAFYYDYDDLFTMELDDWAPGFPFFGFDLTFQNGMKGKSWGGEAIARWQILRYWRVEAGYSFIKLKLDARTLDDPMSVLFSLMFDQEFAEGQSPRHQAQFRSRLDLPWNFEFDASLYYVDDVSTVEGIAGSVKIPSYLRGDFQLGWRPTEKLEFSLALLNAFDDSHPEWTSEFGYLATRIPRSFYGKVTGRFF
jgi:iron complex outermembrane receptor protein